MTGQDSEIVWPPPGAAGTGQGGHAWPGGQGEAALHSPGPPGPGQRPRAQGHQGPRWVVAIRALVVVLAMLAAALGVLWLEAASVQGVSANLPNQPGGHITVPPLAPRAAASPPLAPQAAASPPLAPQAAAADADGTVAGTPATGTILVHVVGAVSNPGVYALGEGSRVYQAVTAAGGALPTAQLAALNMAAPASDGMQIVVHTLEEAAQLQHDPGPGTAGSDPAARNVVPGPVNINTATAADLDALPGIGPVLAERIIAWRTDHGPFPSVDALDAVSGIGTKLLANIRGLVSVS